MKRISSVVDRLKARLQGWGSGHPGWFSPFGSIPREFNLIFIAAITLALVYGRWLSILYPVPLNPDEAQAAANALRIKAYGFNWAVLDGSTNGPLDSLALCWPYVFGWDVTLSTTRLTGCVLLVLICAFVYLSAKAFSGRVLAALLVLPLVIFYALTTAPDFLHYSSELLPMCLLTAANYLTLGMSLKRTHTHGMARFALLGLLLGAVPFAKLQAAPIALLIGLYALFLAGTGPRSSRVRSSVSLICAGLAPAGGFLLPLLVSGHIGDFWHSYIAYAFLYVKEPLSVSEINGMIAGDLLLLAVTYFMISLILAASLHSFFLSAKGVTPVRKAMRPDLIYSTALVVAAFWVIAKPGNNFNHYLTFYPPFLVILCACLVHAFAGRVRHGIVFAAYYAAFALAFVVLFLSGPTNRTQFWNLHHRFDPQLQQTFQSRSPRILSWLPIPATHLLVWGWMPQWYVWSGLTPATRETTTSLQIANTSMQGYFRSRFMSDVHASSPEVVIDGVTGKSFLFNDPSKASPGVFPEFAALLSAGYSPLQPLAPGSACPKIYVRNDYAGLISSRLVVPASVVASATFMGDDSAFRASNLFDDSVTEDSCTDYWLLPTRRPGSVRAAFAKVEPVSSVWILNTHNGEYLDRASKDVQIELLHGSSVVGTRRVTLRPYPYWTAVDFAAPVQADSLEVDVLSFYGHGGGLNEIKIYKDWTPPAPAGPDGPAR